MASVRLRILLTENSYSIANNTSVCTAVVQLASQGKSWSNYQCPGSLWLNGSNYRFTSTFTKSTSWQTLYTLSNVTIPHWDDGSKTLAASVSFATGVSVGTLTASASLTLTQLYRKSDLEILTQNIKFGDTVDFKITSKNDAFVHTVWIGKTGSLNWQVMFDRVKAGVHSYTIPEEWARYVTGTDTTFQIYMTTYYGSTDLGSTDYGAVLHLTPLNTMAPVVELVYNDTNQEQYNRFGGYIQNKSKLNVGINVTFAYNATFVNGIITVDGQIYNITSESDTCITLPIASLTPKIEAIVTDSRGMTGRISTVLSDVLPYQAPQITNSNIFRTLTASSTEDNPGGSFLRIVASGKVSTINGKNPISFKFKVQTANSSFEQTPEEHAVNIDSKGNFTISYIIPREVPGSANVLLEITDAFTTYSLNLSLATPLVKTVCVNTNLKSIAIGKIPEYSGLETNDIHLYNKLYGHQGAYTKPLIVSKGDTVAGNIYGAVTLVLDSDSIGFNLPVSALINGIGLRAKKVNAYIREVQGSAVVIVSNTGVSDITQYCKVQLSSTGAPELLIEKQGAFSKYVSNFQPLIAYITYELEVE